MHLELIREIKMHKNPFFLEKIKLEWRFWVLNIIYNLKVFSLTLLNSQGM